MPSTAQPLARVIAALFGLFKTAPFKFRSMSGNLVAVSTVEFQKPLIDATLGCSADNLTELRNASRFPVATLVCPALACK
jgi:hypothetical protein